MLPSTTVLDLRRPNAEVDSGSCQWQGDPTNFGVRQKLEMCVQPGVRKFVTICKSAHVERFRETPASWRSIAVAAVPAIPWAGRLVAIPKFEIRACGQVLGELLTGRPPYYAGDRHQEPKDLGHDVDNPAAV